MASVVFVLPGLVIVGAWTGFPFWTTFLICAVGGVLGVMYTIPLRRALIKDQHGFLKYPEGTACAQVLIAGASDESRAASLDAEKTKTDESATNGGKIIAIGFAMGFAFNALMQVFIQR